MKENIGNVSIGNSETYFNITAEDQMKQNIIKPENDSGAIYNYGSETVDTVVSSVSTREIQVIDTNTDYLLLDTLIGDQFKVDAKPFIERPFYLTTIDWPATLARGSMLLNQNFCKMPGDVLRSNPSLLSATKVASLYKCDLELCISVAGTITHAGCVIAGVIPPVFGDLDYTVNHESLINTILSGPHVRLFANEATSAIIKVPWYCNSEMATLDMELPSSNYVPSVDITLVNGNYGTLVFVVLNQLQPSAGSSTSLKITVEAIFKSLDMRVPTPRYIEWRSQSSFLSSVGTGLLDTLQTKAKTISADFIDKARSYIKFKTGLHNPNTSQIAQRVITTDKNFLNTIDTQTFYEKLDTKQSVDRIVDFPVFNTSTDEMTVQHIVSKKQYIGTFRVNVDDPTGTLLWSRPISPNQYAVDSSIPASTYTNNIRLLHDLSRAWRGDLVITIEAIMNNKQQVKLRLLQLYNPSMKVLDAYPDYRSILNAPSHLMEFSAGGQTHSITLPYLCRNELTPCAVDLNTEATFHGVYYVYLAQPLANSGDSPKDVYFNMYIQGTDSLQFYGYSTECYTAVSPVVTTPIKTREGFKSESMTVMNDPQKQSDDENIKKEINFVNRLQKIDSMRDIIRRVYNVNKFSMILAPGYNYKVLDIDPIWFEGPNYFGNLYDIPLRVVSSMYYGKFPSTKFQIRILTFKNEDQRNENIVSSIYYYPQQMYDFQPLGTVNGSIPIDTTASIVLNDQNVDFPLPYQNVPTHWNQTMNAHEFMIPNTSLYKFVGGPKKMSNKYPLPDSKLSTQDCGNLLFVFFNPYSTDLPIEVLVNAGAGDEARLGFHSIAPFISYIPISGERIMTTGAGTFDSVNSFPELLPRLYINYTRI